MITSNKDQLIKAVAEQAKITLAAAKRAVEAISTNLVETVQAEGRFVLTGVGTFKLATAKARTGRNPSTGNPVEVQEKKVVRFKMGQDLKRTLNPSG